MNNQKDDLIKLIKNDIESHIKHDKLLYEKVEYSSYLDKILNEKSYEFLKEMYMNEEYTKSLLHFLEGYFKNRNDDWNKSFYRSIIKDKILKYENLKLVVDYFNESNLDNVNKIINEKSLEDLKVIYEIKWLR